MAYTSHYTVLKKETVDWVTENSDTDQVSYFVDLTFGGGGHSLELLNRSQNFKVIAFDQDPEAIANAELLIKEHNLGDRLKLVKSNFSHLWDVLNSDEFSELKKFGLSGAIADLGVSSHHFDDFSRGFSFRGEAYLDMRMAADDDEVETAADILNTRSEEELTNIFREYGEERFASRIAQNIVNERTREKITSTKELENIVFHSYPKKMRFGRIHPATRTFQALRIAVNDELNILKDSIMSLYNLLKPSGRIGIISFHSLEDRIVKNTFRELYREHGARRLTKKPILPSDAEINENSRSRSAKLRVVEKP